MTRTHHCLLYNRFSGILIRKISNNTIKINFLAMQDSMFNLARSTSRVCDIADRKKIFTSLSFLKNLSADATA